jgi:hypothetical protein
MFFKRSPKTEDRTPLTRSPLTKRRYRPLLESLEGRYLPISRSPPWRSTTSAKWRARKLSHPRRSSRCRLTVELLESRDLLSGLTLTPLVQVSSNTRPFLGTTADLSQQTPVAFNREAENMSAVNPTNPKNMIDVWRQDQGNFNAGASSLGLVGAATFDGGVTWKEVVIPGLSIVSGGHFQCATDPWVSFGPTGIAYATTVAFDLSGPGFAGDVLVNISRDGGLTWSAPITIRHDTDPNFFNDKDSITADPFNPNLVYATWFRGNFPDGAFNRNSSPFNGYKQPTLFARSTDGGVTWQPTQIIYDNNRIAPSRFCNLIATSPPPQARNRVADQTERRGEAGPVRS